MQKKYLSEITLYSYTFKIFNIKGPVSYQFSDLFFFILDFSGTVLDN